MTSNGAKVGVFMRSAIRLYLIMAGLMFIGGAAGGALLAIAGYDLTQLF